MNDITFLSDQELLNYKSRLENDIAKNNSFQLARKEQLNSAYGAFGNNYFRYFDVRLAEAVTKSGQYVIRKLMNDINIYLNNLLKTNNVDYIIASDTDSLVISLEKIIDTFLSKEKQKDVLKVIDKMNYICNNLLQKLINKSCQQIGIYLNVKTQAISMKREVLADRVIWLSKKRYVMSVYDSENIKYNEPYFKIMGIEAVRSSTPEICRKKIKEALKIIMHREEYEIHSFIENFEKEFKQLSPEEIAFPRTVNGLLKYKSDNNTKLYKTKTPIHVRGSLIYNSLLVKNNLLKKYEIIKEGEKIKFLYLKEPNSILSNVISFVDVIPDEFELANFIDYKTQFEKTFIDPLLPVLQTVSWNIKPKRDLSIFFS